MSEILKVENLVVKYGKHEVLSDVSFVINKSEYVGIIGPNGSGKTTLVKALLGLIPTASGRITISNHYSKQLNKIDVVPGKIGYLPQKAASEDRVFPGKVKEIVATGLTDNLKHPFSHDVDNKKNIKDTLELLQISDLANQTFGSLSGGQKQRVLLARAMVDKPDILILDEPTSALDPNIRKGFYSIINNLKENTGTTILLVSHDVSTVGKYVDKILFIDRTLKFFGPYEKFLEENKNENNN